MVKRGKLELDDALRKDVRRGRREKKPDSGPIGFSFTDRADIALFVSIVLAIVILVLAVLDMDPKKESWVTIVLMGLAFLASELFALRLRAGGRLSLALLVVVIVVMRSGPLGAALVPLFGIPVYYMDRGDGGTKRMVFNTCQYVFCAGAAGLVFKHIGGNVLAVDLSNAAKLILPWLLATIVFYVFNTVLVTPVLASGDKMVRYWEKRLLPKFPGYLLYAAIGFLGAIAYTKMQFTGVVLLLAPLLLIRVVYTRYATMRDVCDDTTLAIMEAVEAGNMFSEGHSVGVADMAVAIAEEMNFAEDDLHYLRQAALLHDIGKLALDPAVVNKPGVLTDEEYQEIKKHPLIGASIVSREKSFEPVAPAIRHHHELMDGTGYVDGLAGVTIPIGARILSVADAFQAMQHRTPYREPMTSYTASSEIIRAKGIQFDPEVVDAFIKVVTRRGVWEGALKERVATGEAAAEVEQPQLPVSVEQPTLAQGEAGEEETPPPRGHTPAEGIVYDEVRDEIEKDMREWERADIERQRRRTRGEPRRRTGSLRKKRQEGEKPER